MRTDPKLRSMVAEGTGVPGETVYICDDCNKEYTLSDLPKGSDSEEGRRQTNVLGPCEDCGCEYYDVKLSAESR